jgi:hypothetical protein
MVVALCVGKSSSNLIHVEWALKNSAMDGMVFSCLSSFFQNVGATALCLLLRLSQKKVTQNHVE